MQTYCTSCFWKSSKQTCNNSRLHYNLRFVDTPFLCESNKQTSSQFRLHNCVWIFGILCVCQSNKQTYNHFSLHNSVQILSSLNCQCQSNRQDVISVCITLCEVFVVVVVVVVVFQTLLSLKEQSDVQSFYSTQQCANFPHTLPLSKQWRDKQTVTLHEKWRKKNEKKKRREKQTNKKTGETAFVRALYVSREDDKNKACPLFAHFLSCPFIGV